MTATQARRATLALMDRNGRVPAWALEMALTGQKPTWAKRPKRKKRA